MRSKQLTPTAEQTLREIYFHIKADNPAAAERYYQQALAAFFDFPDLVTPRRAAEHLPANIHSINVGRPYHGYTLRIAIVDDTMYLLAAFAPGLPDHLMDARTLRGLDEV